MRALIVDDSRALRRILRELLEQQGIEVAEAAHGGEALERLTAGPLPDVLLVDWNMPVMNGLELVRAVRQQRVWDLLPIVMVTTETEIQQMSLALAAGANEYVMKPFGGEVIVEKLRLLKIGEARHA